MIDILHTCSLAALSLCSPGDLTADRTRLYFQDEEERVWVRGETYKARFDRDGMRYVPFFGSDAPCNHPIDFTLREATLGDTALSLSPEARVSRHGDRILLDRGPIEVVVEVGVDRVEQSFVVDAAREDRDLRLVLDIETSLAAEMEGGELVLGGALGSVRYSEAYVLDGAGRREQIASAFDGAAITLTVPASFLARAEGEIVVDPVIRTFSVSAMQGEQRDVDVSFDLTTNQFLYVFEDVFSGTDVDILAIAVDADTGIQQATEYYDASDDSWVDPSVANANCADTSLCVAAFVDPNVATPVRIARRIWDHHQGVFGPLVQITGISNSAFPDVGGSSTEAPDGRFCVAWSTNVAGFSGEVLYTTIPACGGNGNLGGLSTPGVLPTGTLSISESSGDPGSVDQWQIVWTERAFGFPGTRLSGAVVNGDGSVRQSAPLRDFDPPDLIRDVHVSEARQIGSFADPTYAILYDLDSVGDEDTVVSLVRGTTIVHEIELQRSEHSGFRPDQSEARIATTADRFVVSYLEQLPSTAYRAFVTSFGVVEDTFLAVAERRTDLGTVTPPGFPFHDGGALSMASKFSGGLYASTEVGIGIDRATAGPPDVDAAIFDDTSPPSPARQYCYGNRNSTGFRGFIRMEGDASASTLKTLRASGLPPGSFGYFVVGDGFANVANPAGSAGVLCVSGAVGRYVQQLQAADAAGEISIPFDPTVIPQPNGTVAGMAGDHWQFTLWHRDMGSMGLPTSNFTNAVSIELQ